MKTGEIDPYLKSRIDSLQFVIDKYLDGISACLMAGHGLHESPPAVPVAGEDESNAVYFFRRRIKTLMLEKWELTKQV